MRRTTSSELGAVERQLVLVGLGQQLAVVRELAVDQARRERQAVDLEDDLVGAHADADRLVALGGRGAPAPAARARARWPRSRRSSGASRRVSLTLRR